MRALVPPKLSVTMRTRPLASTTVDSTSTSPRLPLRMALWLLDSQRLGHTKSVKRIAGRMLKQPALEGVVEAQSRLGRLLCTDCDSQRDRRIGFELLRQAARAGDCQAQLELGQLYCQPQYRELGKARHWLEQAAAQGSAEASRVLQRLPAKR